MLLMKGKRMTRITYQQPKDGAKITIQNGQPVVPDNPVILFIEGDGVGPDIWAASKRVFDAAVEKSFSGKRRISWLEIFAGQKSFDLYGEWLPAETVDAIRDYVVAIKGPLTTPVGGGIRSLNVTLRQELDLYACIRPVRYFEGVPSPVKEPWKLNVVIFRENTEDVYAGIEWQSGSEECKKIISFLNSEMKTNVDINAGIGIKPMTKMASERLVRRAVNYALNKKIPDITVVHKGNIMKFTEGAFKQWAYDFAEREFHDQIIFEEILSSLNQDSSANHKVIMKNRIADAMFQQILLRPDEYHVIATTNLNGDYLSDACAAIVGGLGMAPGANIGDSAAVFEATHGSAPKYAGQDKVNPGSLILSGAMMFEYLGWDDAALLIYNAVEKTIKQGTVTYDLARNMDNATLLKCSEFGEMIIKNME